LKFHVEGEPLPL